MDRTWGKAALGCAFQCFQVLGIKGRDNAPCPRNFPIQSREESTHKAYVGFLFGPNSQYLQTARHDAKLDQRQQMLLSPRIACRRHLVSWRKQLVSVVHVSYLCSPSFALQQPVSCTVIAPALMYTVYTFEHCLFDCTTRVTQSCDRRGDFARFRVFNWFGSLFRV